MAVHVSLSEKTQNTFKQAGIALKRDGNGYYQLEAPVKPLDPKAFPFQKTDVDILLAEIAKKAKGDKYLARAMSNLYRGQAANPEKLQEIADTPELLDFVTKLTRNPGQVVHDLKDRMKIDQLDMTLRLRRKAETELPETGIGNRGFMSRMAAQVGRYAYGEEASEATTLIKPTPADKVKLEGSAFVFSDIRARMTGKDGTTKLSEQDLNNLAAALSDNVFTFFVNDDGRLAALPGPRVAEMTVAEMQEYVQAARFREIAEDPVGMSQKATAFLASGGFPTPAPRMAVQPAGKIAEAASLEEAAKRALATYLDPRNALVDPANPKRLLPFSDPQQKMSIEAYGIEIAYPIYEIATLSGDRTAADIAAIIIRKNSEYKAQGEPNVTDKITEYAAEAAKQSSREDMVKALVEKLNPRLKESQKADVMKQLTALLQDNPLFQRLPQRRGDPAPEMTLPPPTTEVTPPVTETKPPATGAKPPVTEVKPVNQPPARRSWMEWARQTAGSAVETVKGAAVATGSAVQHAATTVYKGAQSCTSWFKSKICGMMGIKRETAAAETPAPASTPQEKPRTVKIEKPKVSGMLVDAQVQHVRDGDSGTFSPGAGSDGQIRTQVAQV